MKTLFILLFSLIGISGLHAQFGIKAGLNTANELRSFSKKEIAESFSSENLTGYQIGLVYQAMPKKSGIGLEIGALLSQKGCSFHYDSTSIVNPLNNGYKEINYIEIPLNLRYHLQLGIVTLYTFGGIYGGYALTSKSVNETIGSSDDDVYNKITNRIDYGYNVGVGIELLKKIQIGGTWSNGLKSLNAEDSSIKNKVFSLNLVYLL